MNIYVASSMTNQKQHDFVEKGKWRVHTPILFKEIDIYNQIENLKTPLLILGDLLYQVGERAAFINDPVLNKLMVRLTIYTIADRESEDYDPVAVKKILEEKE
jgi:hypothetical protein